jgi:hypothetical protein
MGRWNGKTTDRGYGGTHPTLRKQRVAAHQPGDPCAMGGEPLWQPVELLDVPHDHVNGGYLPGLACREHNRGEGATRGNLERGFRPASAGGDVRCQACGQSYHYAARNCEMCGIHYHPSYGQQRTCSRVCGIELRRQAGNLGNPGPRKQRPTCKTCGRPCSSLRQMYCSPACQSDDRQWPSSRVQHYICRYCGTPGVVKGTAQPREVCPARECQLGRRMANNLRVRHGFTKEEADAQIRAIIQTGHPPAYDQWRQARRW